jgi:hypothetical protein
MHFQGECYGVAERLWWSAWIRDIGLLFRRTLLRQALAFHFDTANTKGFAFSDRASPPNQNQITDVLAQFWGQVPTSRKPA